MTNIKIERLIFAMLTEKTGRALCDSGDAYGRNWEKNATKTLEDFKKEPEVEYSLDFYGWENGARVDTDKASSDDLEFRVSVFHYLTRVLELDDLCEEFNALPVDDWDSEKAYGLSMAGEEWLENRGFEIGDSWNTYNGENTLSQVLQGTELKYSGCGEGDYVLLQVHGGCDVRGGYTDAKLVKYCRFQEYIDSTPFVSAWITKAGGEVMELDSSYHGYKLSQDGEEVEISKSDKVELSLNV